MAQEDEKHALITVSVSGFCFAGKKNSNKNGARRRETRRKEGAGGPRRTVAAHTVSEQKLHDCFCSQFAPPAALFRIQKNPALTQTSGQ
jgi:hypothetical protein